MSLSPVSECEARATPPISCGRPAKRRYLGPNKSLIVAAEVVEKAREYARNTSDCQLVLVPIFTPKHWSGDSGVVILCPGGMVSTHRDAGVNIVASFATGCLTLWTNKNVTRVIFRTDGASLQITNEDTARTEPRHMAVYHPLHRAHVPFYTMVEMTNLFTSYFSAFRQLICTRVSKDKRACALLNHNGCIQCIECSATFDTVEQWAKHFTKPPLLLPTTTTWEKAYVKDGNIAFRAVGRPVGNYKILSPQPHRRHTENSLIDSPLFRQELLEKLEALIFRNYDYWPPSLTSGIPIRAASVAPYAPPSTIKKVV